jgi:hypothetical protein
MGGITIRQGQVVSQYARADCRAVASGGIAGAVGAAKSIQGQKRCRVYDKIGWEGRGQQLGAGIGTVWTVSQAAGPAKENKYAMESLDGHTARSGWKPKRKFRLTACC